MTLWTLQSLLSTTLFVFHSCVERRTVFIKFFSCHPRPSCDLGTRFRTREVTPSCFKIELFQVVSTVATHSAFQDSWQQRIQSRTRINFFLYTYWLFFPVTGGLNINYCINAPQQCGHKTKNKKNNNKKTLEVRSLILSISTHHHFRI